jgi:hypothetical protein
VKHAVLRLAKNLVLKINAITETFAILAKRGMGKTYTAAVMAEQFLKASMQVVIIDPLGVWWGLRADADGKKEGLPVVIFGGAHADVPLESTAGEVIADLVVDQGISAVLDLSEFRKAEQNRFMTAFAERLYHKKKSDQQPLHLMLDEADAFAPQRPQKGEERMLGALEDIVRRGRAKGLGVTLITQRSAVLNKNVLTQAEVLITLRTIAPQDRDAIDDWINIHGDKVKRKEMLESLASLDIGEAWFWSPGWMETFKRIKINKRETFDSSATPKVGAKVRKPKKLAPVDLEKIKVKISATIEKAKQEDPRELKKQVFELTKRVSAQDLTIKTAQRLQKERPPVEPRTKVEARKVYVLSKRQMQRLKKLGKLMSDLSTDLSMAVDPLKKAMDQFGDQSIRVFTSQPAPQPPTPPVRPPPQLIKEGTIPRPASRTAVPAATDDGTPLRKGERKMLTVLYQVFPTALTKAQLGTLAGYAVKGGSFDTYIGTLRRNNFISEHAGTIALNCEAIPEEYQPKETKPLTRDGVVEMWKGRLRKGERVMLDTLLANPKGLTREELGEKSGYTVEGGSFDTYVGNLTRNGLADKSGGVIKISETLFLGAVR